jgi:hypothetical protein
MVKRRPARSAGTGSRGLSGSATKSTPRNTRRGLPRSICPLASHCARSPASRRSWARSRSSHASRPERRPPIRRLRTQVPRHHLDPARHVAHPHRRAALVDVLPARAAAAHRRDLELLGAQRRELLLGLRRRNTCHLHKPVAPPMLRAKRAAPDPQHAARPGRGEVFTWPFRQLDQRRAQRVRQLAGDAIEALRPHPARAGLRQQRVDQPGHHPRALAGPVAGADLQPYRHATATLPRRPGPP